MVNGAKNITFLQYNKAFCGVHHQLSAPVGIINGGHFEKMTSGFQSLSIHVSCVSYNDVSRI